MTTADTDEMNDEAEPITRDARFIKTAIAILSETGRTDFTVQEVVARSKTSLRAFYQHFSTKDDLLLALFDKTMVQSAQAWRAETTGLDSAAALKLVIDRISAPPESTTQDSLNRALSLYNQNLAETRPRDYAQVLSPLHQLLGELVQRGVTEGVFRPGLDVASAAAIVMQTVLGASRLHWLGAELAGTPIDSGQLHDFCIGALRAEPDRPAAGTSLGDVFDQIGLRGSALGDARDDDDFVTEIPVSPLVVNTSGGLQGGLIATLADVAAGSFGLRFIPPGHGLTTADLSVRYLRSIREGVARAVPKILRAGRRSLIAQVDIFRSTDDELAATATLNFAVVDYPTSPAAGHTS